MQTAKVNSTRAGIFFLLLLILALFSALHASAAGTATVTEVHDYPGASDTQAPRSVPAGVAKLLDWQQTEYGGVEYELESITVEKKVPIYTVTFNANGGNPTPNAQNIERGQTADKPDDPARSGYAFGGWYAAADFSGSAWDFDYDTVTGNTILHAKWVQQVYYVVVFVANGGVPVPAFQTVASGQKATKPADPVRSGYAFGGWHREWDFSDPEWDFNNDVVTGNTILYAEWIPLKNVTFDANGGAPTPPVQTVEFGGKVLQPANPFRDEYAFVGWYEDAAFKGPDWDFNRDTVTESMTLYARWLQPVKSLPGTDSGPNGAEETGTEGIPIVREQEPDASPVLLHQAASPLTAATVWETGQPDTDAHFTLEEGNEYRVTYHYRAAAPTEPGVYTVTERYQNQSGSVVGVTTAVQVTADHSYSKTAPVISGYEFTGATVDGVPQVGSTVVIDGVLSDYTVVFTYRYTQALVGGGVNSPDSNYTQIDEQPVPLAQLTELEVIVDEKVPLTGSLPTAAHQSSVGVVGAILLLCGLAAGCFASKNGE